jgi:hypothetical protein
VDAVLRLLAADIPPLLPGILALVDRALERMAASACLRPTFPQDADPEALAGFGRWLGWLWRAGKPLPLPLSRAAVRAASARTTAPISDSRAARATRTPPRPCALLTPRSPPSARASPPRASFQLRPFKPARGATRRAGPLETPLVRQAMWDAQVRARHGAPAARKAIDEIIARFQ